MEGLIGVVILAVIIGGVLYLSRKKKTNVGSGGGRDPVDDRQQK